MTAPWCWRWWWVLIRNNGLAGATKLTLQPEQHKQESAGAAILEWLQDIDRQYRQLMNMVCWERFGGSTCPCKTRFIVVWIVECGSSIGSSTPTEGLSITEQWEDNELAKITNTIVVVLVICFLTVLLIFLDWFAQNTRLFFLFLGSFRVGSQILWTSKHNNAPSTSGR